MKIFVRKKGIKINKEIILIFILIGITSFSYYNYNLDKVNNAFSESIGILFTFITGIYILTFVISNFFRFEKLHGKLKGQLKFEKEFIHFGDEITSVSSIERIEIENWHVKGSIVNATIPYFPRKSNGTGNYVELFMQNGETKICYYQQTESDRIQKFSDIFKTYYNEGLISRQNYLNIIEN